MPANNRFPPKPQDPLRQQWRLVIRDGKSADMMLHRLGLRPSKFNAGEYVGFYALNAKSQLLNHIERLRAVGLHGLARKIAEKRPVPIKSKPKKKRRPAPGAEILFLVATKRARIQHDVEKRKKTPKRAATAGEQREMLRQAEGRARNALLRAKGEM